MLQNVFVLLLFFIAIVIPLLFNNVHMYSVLTDPDELMKLSAQVSMPGMLINALVCIFIFGIVYYRKEAVYLNKKQYGAKAVSFTILGALLCYIVSNIIANLLSPFFRQNEALNDAILAGSFLINIATVGLAVPIVEEILFRGIMFSRLRRYLGSTPAIFISAGVFGLVHFNVIQSIYATIIGIYLGYLVEKYNTIKASILAHIIINSISIILYYTVSQ